MSDPSLDKGLECDLVCGECSLGRLNGGISKSSKCVSRIKGLRAGDRGVDCMETRRKAEGETSLGCGVGV